MTHTAPETHREHACSQHESDCVGAVSAQRHDVDGLLGAPQALGVLRARAGHAVAVFVDDLDERVGGIGARGIVPASREGHGNGVRLVVYRDPDGNEIGFGWARSSGRLIPPSLRRRRWGAARRS